MPPSTTNQPMGGNRHLDHIPEWIRKEFEAAQMEILDAQEKIFNLEIAIKALKEHAAGGTVPRSLSISLSVQVNQRQQVEMDKIFDEAKYNFQKTVLKALIAAREQEVQDRTSDISRTREGFLTTMEDKLTLLLGSNIIDRDIMDPAITQNIIHNNFDDMMKTNRQELRTRLFLNHQKKKDAQNKRRAEQEQRNIDRTLEDGTTLELKNRMCELEKAVKQINSRQPNETTKNTSKKKGSNNQSKNRNNQKKRKIMENHSNQRNQQGKKNNNNNNGNKSNKQRHPKGEGRESGRGNQKRRASYTVSTRPSGSKKKNYQKKQN